MQRIYKVYYTRNQVLNQTYTKMLNCFIILFTRLWVNNIQHLRLRLRSLVLKETFHTY